RLEAAQVSGVVPVQLVVGFPATQVNLGRVDHDHVIAGVEEGREDGLALPGEDLGGGGGELAQHLVLGVEHVPLARQRIALRYVGRHPNPIARCSRFESRPNPARGARDVALPIERRPGCKPLSYGNIGIDVKESPGFRRPSTLPGCGRRGGGNRRPGRVSQPPCRLMPVYWAAGALAALAALSTVMVLVLASRVP